MPQIEYYDPLHPYGSGWVRSRRSYWQSGSLDGEPVYTDTDSGLVVGNIKSFEEWIAKIEGD